MGQPFHVPLPLLSPVHLRTGITHVVTNPMPSLPPPIAYTEPQLLYLVSKIWEGGKWAGGRGEGWGQWKVVIYKACALGTLVLDNNYNPLIN